MAAISFEHAKNIVGIQGIHKSAINFSDFSFEDFKKLTCLL